MNIFTALILSTNKQASCNVTRGTGGRILYTCIATSITDEIYTFEIFHVTYPDRAPGKGLGEPITAEEPHSSKRMSLDEFIIFLETHFDGFEWTPVEED